MINRRSRLTTFVLNNSLWDVKDVKEKGTWFPALWSGLCVHSGLDGWGEITYGLKRQPSIC